MSRLLVLLFLALTLAAGLAGCPAPACRDDANCPKDAPFCVAGSCSVSDAEGEEGEGEEGEGEEGEGEGEEGEGEGEGDPGYVAETITSGAGFAFGAFLGDVLPRDDGSFVLRAQTDADSVDGAGGALPFAACNIASCPGIFGADANGAARWHRFLRTTSQNRTESFDFALAGDVVWVVSTDEIFDFGGPDEQVMPVGGWAVALDADTGALASPVLSVAQQTFETAVAGFADGTAVLLGDADGVTFASRPLIDVDLSGGATVRAVLDTGDTRAPLRFSGDDSGAVTIAGSYSASLRVDDDDVFVLGAGGSGFALRIDADGAVAAAFSDVDPHNLDGDVGTRLDDGVGGRNGTSLACGFDGDDFLVAYDDDGALLARTVLPEVFLCNVVARDDGFIAALTIGPFGAGFDVPIGDDGVTVTSRGDRELVLLSIDDFGHVRAATNVGTAEDDSGQITQSPDGVHVVVAGGLSGAADGDRNTVVPLTVQQP